MAAALGVGYLHVRTCYFDEYIESNAEQCEQLVILGAGFDSRMYRLKPLPKRCFELDMPTTQAEKKAALSEAGIDSSHVTFVSVDFAREDWFKKLCSSGFDKELPTIFLWEGVTYYLMDFIVEGTFSSMAECPHAIVAYDVYYKWFSLDPRTIALMSRGYGEPFQSGVDRDDEGGPTVAVGMKTLDILGADELNRRYVPRNPAGGLVCPAFGGMAIVIASTKPSCPVKIPSSVSRYPTDPVVTWDPAQDAARRALVIGEGALTLTSMLRMISSLIGEDTNDADQPLMEAGLDSMLSVELTEMLQGAVGDAVELPSTLTFDYPSARALVTFIRQETGEEETEEAAPSVQRPGLRASHERFTSPTQVASLGMMHPRGVQDRFTAAAAFSCASDLAGEVPLERWDTESLPAVGGAAADRRRHGGFLIGLELVDHTRFNVSAAEATAMDPQQRMLLERGYEALHTAGHDRASLLNNNPCGVFLGIQANDYTDVLRASPVGGSVYGVTGGFHAIACGRLSYVLGFQGPCVGYDTACSAQLVANHGALRALQLDECPISLVMGVNIMLVPDVAAQMAVAGMTSGGGRCHTFDERADGYLRGEACATFVLQDSEPCQRSRFDLCGSAVRQDGKSASLTAPSGPAQRALLSSCFVDAGITPDALVLMEAHGTGTPLGDPIETGSLKGAVHKQRDLPLTIGSVKACSGHAE